MFTNKIGNRTVPQWIELNNNSATESVNLTGWKLTIESKHDKQNRYVVLTFKDMIILPKQTVLLVATLSRNSMNIPESHIYNVLVNHFSEILPFGVNNLISSTGFFLQLSTPDGTVVDSVGNLDGDSDTQDMPVWELPSGTTENGVRSSILRRYHPDTRMPLLGTEVSSWRRAVDVKLGKSTYYGDRTDVGNPGYTLGGILPVTLSSFQAEHTNAGVVLKWTTESEVDNAGYNILRSETKNGMFKVVNPTLIQGVGTTGEHTKYTWTDRTAQPNTVYYYQIEDVSHAGERQQLAKVRLRGLVSVTGKLMTGWGDLKRYVHY